MSLECPALQYTYKDPEEQFTVIHVYKQKSIRLHAWAQWLTVGLSIKSAWGFCSSPAIPHAPHVTRTKINQEKASLGSLSRWWLRG